MPHTHTQAEDAKTRLDALIPRAIDPAQYARRDLGGISDIDMLALAMRERVNVLIEGPTGTGKSLAPEVLAAELELPFLSIPVNAAIDPAMVWGADRVMPDRTLQYVDSTAALIIQHGGVLVFDEIDMAHPRILAAFHELLANSRRLTLMERGGTVYEAADNLLMVGTLNGRGYEGTARLNVALRRRFAWAFRFDYSREVESRLIRSGALLDFAFAVRDRENMPDIRTDLATPTLQMFERTAALVSVRFAADRLIETFAEGERAGIRRALEMHLPKIAAELGASL